MSPKKQPTKSSKSGNGPGKSAAEKTKKTPVVASASKKASNGKGALAAIDASGNGKGAVMAPTTPTQRQPGVEGRYVYGIIQGNQPATFGKTGIGAAGEPVYTVHNGDVAAVVSKTAV